MARLLYFVRIALDGTRRRPLLHLVASATVAASLFALGVARWTAGLAEAALSSWGEGVELTIYLEPEVEPGAAEALAERLRAEDGVEARVVSPAEALRRLGRDLGGVGDLLEGLPENPLPVSIEVRPPPGRRSAAALEALSRKWSAQPGVAAADWGREWVAGLERLGRVVRGIGALLLLAVLLAAGVVVSAATQLAVHARRDEIEIQRWVGATGAFVRAPFLIEGLLQGATGAVLAGAGLAAAGAWLGPRLSEALSFAEWGGRLPALLEPRSAVELVAAGVALGLVGSLVALRRLAGS